MGVRGRRAAYPQPEMPVSGAPGGARAHPCFKVPAQALCEGWKQVSAEQLVGQKSSQTNPEFAKQKCSRTGNSSSAASSTVGKPPPLPAPP